MELKNGDTFLASSSSLLYILHLSVFTWTCLISLCCWQKLFILSELCFVINMTQVMSSCSLSSSLWCCLRTLTVTDTFNMQLSKQSRLPKDWICKVNWNESVVVVVVSTCCCCLWQHLAVPLIASPPSITPRHVSRVTINISSQLPPAAPILDSHSAHNKLIGYSENERNCSVMIT